MPKADEKNGHAGARIKHIGCVAACAGKHSAGLALINADVGQRQWLRVTVAWLSRRAVITVRGQRWQHIGPVHVQEHCLHQVVVQLHTEMQSTCSQIWYEFTLMTVLVMVIWGEGVLISSRA